MKKSSQAIELIIYRVTDTPKPDREKQVSDPNKKYSVIKELYQSTNGDPLSVLNTIMANNYSHFFLELS